MHWQGTNVMKCSREKFVRTIDAAGVELGKVEIIEGFYDRSLTDEVKQKHGLKNAAIINIDCDLYESTVTVFDFLTPLIGDGTVIYFDDWFYYSAHPKKGERGAFNEWLAKHPEFVATELCKYYPAVSYVINVI